MNKIYEGGTRRAAPEVVKKVRIQVSEACEELIELGARIRPLMVGDIRLGWVRGVHITERKTLSRWYSGMEYVQQVLLLATSLTPEELDGFTAREIFKLAQLVKQMTERDLSLAPYLSAFSTTSTSEYLWHGKAQSLTSFENKVVELPDGARMKILAPSHHAKLWATLCTYREQNKTRLDNMMNAVMIVRPWTGKSVDPLVAELRTHARTAQVDAIEPWEVVVSTRETSVEDGWGHPDDTKEGLLRELKGMLSHDKHEQVMDAFMAQQIAAAQLEHERIEKLQKRRGGPGVTQKEGIVVLTPQEVRERELQMRKGIPRPRVTDNEEGAPSAGERIKKYE